MARPTIYNPEIVNEICLRISDGESVRSIGKDEKMPTKTTIFNWLLDKNKKEFFDQYAKAREIQAENMFEEIVEIADNGSNDWMERNDPDNPGYNFNGEHYQRSRLRVDTRKWYLSKVLPKKFGEAIDVTSGGKEVGIIYLPQRKNDRLETATKTRTGIK